MSTNNRSLVTSPSAANQRLGTAEWSDPAVFTTDFSYELGRLWLGRSISCGQEPIGYIDDRHVCLVSGNRGGKGTSVIINNLCLWPGSVVVIDPKGENATVTAIRRGRGSARCAGLGQAVHVLDPFKVAIVPDEYRSNFNPLDTLDPASEHVIADAGKIASALIVPEEGSKGDPFWDNMARMLLQGLILHVLTAPQYKDRCNLVTVRDLAIEGDWEAEAHFQKVAPEQNLSGHKLLFQGMIHNESLHREILKIGKTFMECLETTPKVFQSVLQVFVSNMEFINSPSMKQCLSKSDFKLSDLKTDPRGVSIYLSLPDRYKGSHFRWLRMMTTLIIGEMEATPRLPACGHNVLLMLDEFAALKRMTVIEDAVAKIAGYGVKLFFVLQTLEQLKAVYKESWETFLACCGTRIFFSVDDHFSREHISKLIGDTEIIVRNRTASQTETDNASTVTGTSDSTAVGRTDGGSQGHSINESDSSSWSEGSSVTNNFSPRFLFGPVHTGFSVNSSSGSSGSRSSSRGTNKGKSWSDTSTSTRGTNSSRTTGHASGLTIGVNESVQKRALISPDEIGRWFSRVDNHKDWRYPGGALILVHGCQPAFIRRVNYFEDGQFKGLFEPHPDHPFNEPLIREIAPPPRMLPGISESNAGRKRKKKPRRDERDTETELRLHRSIDIADLRRNIIRGTLILTLILIAIAVADGCFAFFDLLVEGQVSKLLAAEKLRLLGQLHPSYFITSPMPIFVAGTVIFLGLIVTRRAYNSYRFADNVYRQGDEKYAFFAAFCLGAAILLAGHAFQIAQHDFAHLPWFSFFVMTTGVVYFLALAVSFFDQYLLFGISDGFDYVQAIKVCFCGFFTVELIFYCVHYVTTRNLQNENIMLLITKGGLSVLVLLLLFKTAWASWEEL